MSDEYPTLDSLTSLGFETLERGYGMETVSYRFRYLELKAIASSLETVNHASPALGIPLMGPDPKTTVITILRRYRLAIRYLLYIF